MKTPAKFKEYIWLVKKTQRSRPHVHMEHFSVV